VEHQVIAIDSLAAASPRSSLFVAKTANFVIVPDCTQLSGRAEM
jgi:hypothetical protein